MKRVRASRHDERRVITDQASKCNGCEIPLDAMFHIDHVVRTADGGENERRNLQALCTKCHFEKTRAENARQPVGSVVEVARRRRREGVVKNAVDEMLARDKQQQWGNESVQRLLDWKSEGFLVPAAFNRQPVWGLKSQQEFVLVLLSNQCTAPVYIMRFKDKARMELYDGINRMHAVEQFVSGEFHVKVGGDALWFKKPPNSTAMEMTRDQRQLFLRRDLQVGWWQNLDECEACDMALKLNSGTAANMSERLKWITGIATQRCRLLTRLSKTDIGVFFLDLKERTVLFSWMAEIVMRAVSDTWDSVTVRIVQYNLLEEFFRSETEVEDEDVAFEKCLATLVHVRAFLAVGGKDVPFNIAQLQLLVAAHHRRPDGAIDARRFQAWVQASKRKRMYSTCDFNEALHEFLSHEEGGEDEDEDEDDDDVEEGGPTR